MGFLKKIFKPISRVLDKVIPNEIKPALPYLAAFAPYLLGPGIMGSSMGMRALSNSALNAIGQLSQEGNEGELNPLSLLLAAGQGAGTAEGAGSRLRGFKTKGTPQEIARGNVPGMSGGFEFTNKGLTGLEKAKNFSLEGLANLSDKLGGARDTLQGALDMDPTKANLEKITAAGATPFSQASGDVVYGEAIKQKKDYERSEAQRLVEEEMRQRGLDQSYIDSIIASMTAYGYTQAEIDEILAMQGYARGGRVGARQGGLLASLINSGPTAAQLPALPTRPLESYQPFMGRPAFAPLQKAQAVFPRLNQLEQGVNQAEQSLGSIKERLGNQPRQLISASQGPLSAGLQPFNNPFLQSQAPVGALRSQQDSYKEGGRVGYAMGGGIMDTPEADFISMDEVVENVNQDQLMAGMGSAMKLFETPYGFDRDGFEEMIIQFKEHQDAGGDLGINNFAENFLGMVKKDTPNAPMKMAQGGMMSVLPKGMEMDYRGGGMIPMGSKEKADDVPARVSKNEFVMTADAVRAAGGGSVNKGAQRMYQLMNNLEARA